MTTTKRTTAKPPSFLGYWMLGAKQQPTVEYGPARENGHGGERAVTDVYVNGEWAGAVIRVRYTREHPTHRGSRIAVRGKHNGATEWRISTRPGATSGDDYFGRETKAAAALALVDRYLSRTPK